MRLGKEFIMLGENIKQLRRQKGMSQEELAIRLHVVRQTVSKWENNQSVPDADLLQQIAEVFEVKADALLGAEIKEEANRNEIAEQLARLNEQLAIKNRRAKRIWRTIGIILGAGLVLWIAMAALFANVKSSKTETQEEGSFQTGICVIVEDHAMETELDFDEETC